MATENIIPELSWLCTLLFLVVIVMLITTCVCFKDHERSPEYGTAGRLSITRDSPIVQYQPKNGGTISMISKQSDTSLEDGNLKRNSWTVKDRALPEIPNSTTNSIISNHSAVSDNGQCNTTGSSIDRVKVKSHNKALAPKPPGSDPSKVFPLNGSALLASEGASGVTVTITVNDVPQAIGNSIPGSELHSKSRSPLTASVPGTSNSMVVLKKIEKVENVDNSAQQSTSCEASLYDTVADNVRDRGSQTSTSSSPVRIQIGNTGEPSREGSTSNPSASLAVAGAVPSSDIPYMTPPLLHNPPMSAVDQVEESNVAGDRSEVPYNVISVREPLARVREKTLRKQRTPVHQNSDVSEDHYAVPEEEQMYAEIGSGHDSGSSSITYAHIEPRELPPVPPTVESLKSVAHAHSRQASSVSTSSFGSCISNPGEPSSPPLLRNPSTSLYSTVEKSNKQRKTIHIAEGASLVTTAEKRKKVEDLYAKVRKKRVDMTINISDSDDYFSHPSHISYSTEGAECMTPPPSPWASTTPPAPPPIAGRLQAASLGVLLPGHSQHIRRHSADPNLPDIINENRVFCGSTHSSLSVSNKDVEEPDYERIYNEENNSGDSCYEKIKEESSAVDTNLETGYDGFHHSDVNHQRDANYPGYEIVKDSVEDDDSVDPGYECVAQSTSENDPGYEPVRVAGNFEDSDSNSDYTVVKLDDSREPDYERVKKVHRSESDAADPGYEKIKKVLRTGSDATDPGYERVQNKSSDIVDHSYETVQRSDSDTDPGYERVHKDNDSSNGHSDQNYKNFNSPSLPIHTANSTVLFLSGKSEISKQDMCDGDYDKTSSSSITSLTSL